MVIRIPLIGQIIPLKQLNTDTLKQIRVFIRRPLKQSNWQSMIHQQWNWILQLSELLVVETVKHELYSLIKISQHTIMPL